MAAKPPFDRLKAYKPMAIVNAPPHERKHLLRRFWLPAVLLLALAAGGLTGIIAAYQLNYSRAANEVAALATYRPSVVTRVYADDGETVIGEFALEKRIPLKYDEIPPVMKNAILAVEDARFYDHVGIDPIRIIGAAWKNLTTDKVEGGSTLTQQLAKNLFLSKEQTYQAQSERMGPGASDRALLHQEPDHGALRQPHLSWARTLTAWKPAPKHILAKQAKDLTHW